MYVLLLTRGAETSIKVKFKVSITLPTTPYNFSGKKIGLAFSLDFLQYVKVGNFDFYSLHYRATGRMGLISISDVIPGVQA